MLGHKTQQPTHTPAVTAAAQAMAPQLVAAAVAVAGAAVTPCQCCCGGCSHAGAWLCRCCCHQQHHQTARQQLLPRDQAAAHLCVKQQTMESSVCVHVCVKISAARHGGGEGRRERSPLRLVVACVACCRQPITRAQHNRTGSRHAAWSMHIPHSSPPLASHSPYMAALPSASAADAISSTLLPSMPCSGSSTPGT